MGATTPLAFVRELRRGQAMVDVAAYARGDRPAIFLEITEREDLGADLRAPQNDEAGGNRYWLITEALPGDTVLHYHRPSDGIVAISRVGGPPEEGTILWAAKGASAKAQELEPYERPSWQIPLVGFQYLDPTLGQAEVVAKRHQVFQLREALEAEHGAGLQFPYYRYGADQLRTLQAYMAIFPRELVEFFPALAAQVTAFEADELPVQLPDPDPAAPDLYLADENITVNHGGQVTIDPQALERANQTHARLQNQLRERALGQGADLTAVLPGANVDLAWTKGGRQVIAEVKSLTPANETHQIRYGLGQLLDYRDVYADGGVDAHCVLFLPRPPTRREWIRKCGRVDVEVRWPGNWPHGL